MKILSAEYLDDLSRQAKANQRKRQHRNIHESYEDACQRLLNAIEPDSYIRPHRHAVDPGDELLIAIRGAMCLVTFDEQGTVTESLRFGSEKHGVNSVVGVEVPANTWHTVVAFEPSCVLLEVKAGPFDPDRPKDLAPWAPDEGEVSAHAYLKQLVEQIAK